MNKIKKEQSGATVNQPKEKKAPNHNTKKNDMESNVSIEDKLEKIKNKFK